MRKAESVKEGAHVVLPDDWDLVRVGDEAAGEHRQQEAAAASEHLARLRLFDLMFVPEGEEKMLIHRERGLGGGDDRSLKKTQLTRRSLFK